MTEILKLDHAAVASLLKAYLSKRWKTGRPRPSMGDMYDRYTARLFEGTTRLDAWAAVERSAVLGEYYYDPVMAGEVLRWSVRQGLVDFSCIGSDPVWTLRQHGVAFVPRGRSCVDVRTAGPRIGARSTKAVIVMEAARRVRRDAEDLRRTNALNLELLDLTDPDMPLPLELCADDLPPVETVGALRNNYMGFGEYLPLHRARQVSVQLFSLPRKAHNECREDAASEVSHAHELDDFRL